MLQSTAVRKAARSMPADGVNGVVYYCVEENTSGFSTGLAEAIGLQLEEFSAIRAILDRIMVRSTEKNAALKLEPEMSWVRVRKHLEAAAEDFK